MANVVIDRDELFEYMIKASDYLDVVTSTMGPGGKNVILPNGGYGASDITKDGYKVAKSLNPENAKVAQLLKLLFEATSKSNSDAGDGTTTTTELVRKFIAKLPRYLAYGVSGRKLAEGMAKATNVILEKLSKVSVKVTDDEQLVQVATISANGEHEIGKLIAQAMREVGREGVITVEEGKGTEHFSMELHKGMVFDRGFISPYFASNSDKMVITLDKPSILLTNKKISNLQVILKLLEEISSNQKPLLIIAEDVEGEALTSLVLNKMRGSLNVVAVKAPGFGDRRSEMLEDIRVLVGAEHVVSDESGISFSDIDISSLGQALKVTVSKESTIIVIDENDTTEEAMMRKEAIAARADKIREAIDSATSDYDREKLRERLAKLVGGVCALKVGGITEVEVKERKDRVEDALHATRAAIEEGIVPGGGVAFLRLASELDDIESDDADVKAGVDVVKQVLKSPAIRILKNAGENSHVIVNQLLENKSFSYIFDSRNSKFVDAYDSGIVDPAKVLRIALQSAISIVSVLVTTSALIVDLPKKDEGDASAHAGGGMGGMGGMGF